MTDARRGGWTPKMDCPERQARARELQAGGASIGSAARSMGVSVPTLLKWARGEGVRFLDARHARSPMTSPELADEARRLDAEGVYLREAARRMEVPESTLRYWAEKVGAFKGRTRGESMRAWRAANPEAAARGDAAAVAAVKAEEADRRLRRMAAGARLVRSAAALRGATR